MHKACIDPGYITIPPGACDDPGSHGCPDPALTRMCSDHGSYVFCPTPAPKRVCSGEEWTGTVSSRKTLASYVMYSVWLLHRQEGAKTLSSLVQCWPQCTAHALIPSPTLCPEHTVNQGARCYLLTPALTRVCSDPELLWVPAALGRGLI